MAHALLAGGANPNVVRASSSIKHAHVCGEFRPRTLLIDVPPVFGTPISSLGQFQRNTPGTARQGRRTSRQTSDDGVSLLETRKSRVRAYLGRYPEVVGHAVFERALRGTASAGTSRQRSRRTSMNDIESSPSPPTPCPGT